MEDPREDALTFDELEKRPVVLLSDEAHHLSAATKADKKEQEAEKTWEYTVSRLLNAHEDNLLPGIHRHLRSEAPCPESGLRTAHRFRLSPQPVPGGRLFQGDQNPAFRPAGHG